MAVDVPPNVSYKVIKEYLDKGEKESRWSYKEACLGQ
ncbi:hypothetical protein KK078_21485 [Fulvivirgaceae bacterium PWU37]|uniref:Uncharacterized protein n=1 Tax=Dawidia soli TaxID=2782352 RepID=A0AAP2GKK9_9BACT|nr:hypothetical protein [Dawidia soli]